MKMKALFTLISIFFFSNLHICYGQFVSLSDSCFRNALLKKHPGYLNKDNLLDTNAARNYYAGLDLSNGCIKNLEDLKYFKNITSLNLNQNLIQNVEPLKKNKSLQYLMLNNNQIEDLRPLYELKNLIHLEISSNKIEFIPTPDTIWKIRNLYCSRNNLKNIGSLDKFTDLQYFILSYNPIDNLPDLGQLKSLQQLHINNTNIVSISGINRDKLTHLYAHYCKISDLSDLDSNTSIKYLTPHHCNLQKLPYLENKSLTDLQVNNNNLTFKALMPLTKQANFNRFTISPQNNFYVTGNRNYRTKDTLKIRSSIDADADNTIYQWRNNQTTIQNSSSNTLVINNLSLKDSGTYWLELRNSLLPDMVLQSEKWKVSIAPCIEAYNFAPELIQTDCYKGSTYEFKDLTIMSNNPPFTYVLKHLNGTPISSSQSPHFKNVQPGKYLLEITDLAKCQISENIIFSDSEDCERVFSPDGDGMYDDYLIPIKGTTKILSAKGELILKLNTPAVWNGTDSQGKKVQPGYYILLTNDNYQSGVNVVY